MAILTLKQKENMTNLTQRNYKNKHKKQEKMTINDNWIPAAPKDSRMMVRAGLP